MDSPEQGLLVVPIFSDILPQSGGTTIALRFLLLFSARCAAAQSPIVNLSNHLVRILNSLYLDLDPILLTSG